MRLPPFTFLQKGFFWVLGLHLLHPGYAWPKFRWVRSIPLISILVSQDMVGWKHQPCTAVQCSGKNISRPTIHTREQEDIRGWGSPPCPTCLLPSSGDEGSMFRSKSAAQILLPYISQVKLIIYNVSIDSIIFYKLLFKSKLY